MHDLCSRCASLRPQHHQNGRVGHMSAMVKLDDFYWRYPSFGDAASNPWSLNGINLEVAKGEFFGLTGPSGAGKTTTCKAIMGIIPHGSKIPFQRYNEHLRGTVWVDGELVT